MNEHSSNWSKKELKAYILLYCAHADFIESKEEIDLIRSKVGKHHYAEIHDEFSHDTDFQRIQKIQSGLKHHEYSAQQLEDLLNDIREVFFADGHIDTLETNLLMALKHLVK